LGHDGSPQFLRCLVRAWGVSFGAGETGAPRPDPAGIRAGLELNQEKRRGVSGHLAALHPGLELWDVISVTDAIIGSQNAQWCTRSATWWWGWSGCRARPGVRSGLLVPRGAFLRDPGSDAGRTARPVDPAY
jgi:hypothetical protein